MLRLSRDPGIFSGEFLLAPHIKGLGGFITAYKQPPSHGAIRCGLGQASVLDPAFFGTVGKPQVPPCPTTIKGWRRVARMSSGTTVQGPGSGVMPLGSLSDAASYQLFITWSHRASLHQSHFVRLLVGLSESL